MGQKFDRWATLSVQEGMAAIRAYWAARGRPGGATPEDKAPMLAGMEVPVTGLRLHTFISHPLCCADPSCGMVPTHFAIERTLVPDGHRLHRYHLNMYGRHPQGHEVLFTHDHVLARALGGADALDNTAIMCSNCNQRKSRLESRQLDERQQQIREGVLPGQDEVPRHLAYDERWARHLLSHARRLDMAPAALVEQLNGRPTDIPPDRAPVRFLTVGGLGRLRDMVQTYVREQSNDPVSFAGRVERMQEAVVRLARARGMDKKEFLAYCQQHAPTDTPQLRPAKVRLAEAMGITPAAMGYLDDLLQAEHHKPRAVAKPRVP